jgi:hypothetical protein
MRRAGEMSPIWIGLRGEAQRLTVIVQNSPGRSPHYWVGPTIEAGRPFSIRLMLHAGMGPGGIMFKLAADHGWSSMPAASPWGLERANSSDQWIIGHGEGGAADRPFKGTGLAAFVAG